MNLNKICPDCETEYLPHIQKCADCGVILLLPEEHREAQEGKKRTEERTVENTAVVREGDLGWMSELRAVLINAGIACTIHSDAGCRKGCCGNKCRLLVSTDDLERAQERIEEYFMEIEPDFRTSNELIREGKCPACGSPVDTEERECPDCGLPLLIVEEE
jgi:rRNA maturation endonuclease Nob1